ncbi:hypothetical protein PspLS_02827 [Pyricularia sp. CBS 133598]|nr:hypothetical protein PspLS_02827 [Pyricularia sp. CBS 133598]
MSLYSSPPPYRDFLSDKPTLLVCWWATIFCATIILLRIGGRFVRSETLFTEDKIAALAILPLFARMGCVHVILLWGTNNADFRGVELSQEQVHLKEMASRLVLLSRILHVATLWVLKAAILEFFKRLTGVSWQKSYDVALIIIRCLLGLTFLAVVASALGECRPFDHYWQVLPDPGGQCRQGYAHLLTMSICNVMTDLILVLFPAPIIIRSAMTVKRKFQLVLLFSLSLSVVAVTLYRVPTVISHRGSQQIRSLLASIELLFATAASNSLVLGTFVRDRGVKKRRFKYGSIAADSLDRTSSRSRRPTVVRHWGSDEDLVRGLGLGVQPDLRDRPESPGLGHHSCFHHPAPMARLGDIESWQFPSDRRASGGGRSETMSDSSLLNNREQLVYSSRSNSTTTPRKVSFFDVGGLLSDDEERTNARRDSRISAISYQSGIDPLAIPRTGPPSPTVKASSLGSRRGSTALLQDMGGLFGSLGAGSNGTAGGFATRTGTKIRSPGLHYSSPGMTELEAIPQEPRFESSHPNEGRTTRRESSDLDDSTMSEHLPDKKHTE